MNSDQSDRRNQSDIQFTCESSSSVTSLLRLYGCWCIRYDFEAMPSSLHYTISKFHFWIATHRFPTYLSACWCEYLEAEWIAILVPRFWPDHLWFRSVQPALTDDLIIIRMALFSLLQMSYPRFLSLSGKKSYTCTFTQSRISRCNKNLLKYLIKPLCDRKNEFGDKLWQTKKMACVKD